jgi:hypothetical protein
MAEVLTMKEMASKPAAEPRHWIVDGLLHTHTKRPSCILCYAEAGKSTLAAQLSIAVSQGTPFLGRKTERSNVIYWKSEESDLDTFEDFSRAGAASDGSIVFVFPQLEDNNFTVLNDALKNHPSTRLVIIETMADFFKLNDVTSNDEERKCLDKFTKRVTEKYPDCVFVLLHHFNKTDLSVDSSKLSIAKILGGTAFAAGTATKIYLQQVSDADTRRVLLATTRKGDRINPTYLDFDPSTSTSTLGLTVKAAAISAKRVSKSKKDAEMDERILQLLNEDPGTPKWTLAERVGGSSTVVASRIEALIKLGVITETQSKDRSHAKKLNLVTMLPIENTEEIPRECTMTHALPITNKGSGVSEADA